jgi:hypothetical protein
MCALIPLVRVARFCLRTSSAKVRPFAFRTPCDSSTPIVPYLFLRSRYLEKPRRTDLQTTGYPRVCAPPLTRSCPSLVLKHFSSFTPSFPPRQQYVPTATDILLNYH